MTDQTSTAKPERKLSRFLIYRTDDSGVTLELIGQRDAGSSDGALRSFFAEFDTLAGMFTAISENNCKIRRRDVEVTTKANIVELGAPTFEVSYEPLPLAEEEHELEGVEPVQDVLA